MERFKSEMENTQKRTLDVLNELENFKEKLSNEFNGIKEQNRLDLNVDSVSIPAVAFQSRNPSTTNPPSGDKIVFTDTLHDSTHSYDNKTGIFTTPVAGTYLFNVQLCLATGTRYIYYAIYVESTAVTGTLLYDSSERFCSSATAIVHLRKDDNVYIKVPDTNGNALREAGFEWNMFSGVLLNSK
ncbi:collagen alpha-2(VIII) chain-like [Mercenaria mercenaria]|uniref:collagen alpha-2(VIII) chain-like n=1 Tax=Mercenaria mercenaria TaxID=6596 RepID=UPI00234E8D72|nr:collagen alpha-2(VIII) chain-like [Mercenaria mercenaria]